MFKLITLTELGSGVKIYVNIFAIFTFFRPPGTEYTEIKSISSRDQVRETPEEIIALIGPPTA
jgi:hypothetical protein